MVFLSFLIGKCLSDILSVVEVSPARHSLREYSLSGYETGKPPVHSHFHSWRMSWEPESESQGLWLLVHCITLTHMSPPTGGGPNWSREWRPSNHMFVSKPFLQTWLQAMTPVTHTLAKDIVSLVWVWAIPQDQFTLVSGKGPLSRSLEKVLNLSQQDTKGLKW